MEDVIDQRTGNKRADASRRRLRQFRQRKLDHLPGRRDDLVDSWRNMLKGKFLVVLFVVPLVELRIQVMHLEELAKGNFPVGLPGFLHVQMEMMAKVHQAKELCVISLGKETSQQEISGHEGCSAFHGMFFVCVP